MAHQHTHYTSLPAQQSWQTSIPSLSGGDSQDDMGKTSLLSREASTASGFGNNDAVQHLVPRKPVGGIPPVEKGTHEVRVQPRQAHILRNWSLEIGACLFFIVALLATVATLYPHQGKPLPNWPCHISANSLISIYVVILKAAVAVVTAQGLSQLKWSWFEHGRPLEDLVRYDQASRGPLGAVSLLWSLRERHILASLGALIIITSTVIDPFAQQVVHYYDCSVPLDTAQVSLPRSNFYSGQGYHTGAGDESVAPAFMSAINAGVFSPGANVNFNCVTGNCTFTQEYSTVAYCSDCKDITHDSTFTNTSRLSNYTTDANGNNVSETIYDFTTSLPSGLSMTIEGYDDSPTYAVMGLGLGVEFILGRGDPLLPVIDPMTRAPLLGCDSAEAKKTWKCQGYGASTCLLYPCVRTYNATIEAGKLQEKELSKSSQGQLGFGIANNYLLWTVIDRKCLSAHETQELRNAGYKIEDETDWIRYNINYTNSPIGNGYFYPSSGNTSLPESMLTHQCLYLWDASFSQGLYDEYLVTFMNGTIEGSMAETGVIDYTGPQVLQTIYNYGDITFDRMTSIFANISDSMTSYMRQNGQVNHTTPVAGIVTHNQTCLGVRWGWLAFPTVLVALTLIFFILMII